MFVFILILPLLPRGIKYKVLFFIMGEGGWGDEGIKKLIISVYSKKIIYLN
jgi:hypothetical protein